MRYRRAFVPGGSFFFTLVTAGRKPILQSEQTIATLREAFRRVRSKRPFTIDAIVILPDPLHCIWTLPPGDSDFSTRWRLVKTWFAKHCDDSPCPETGREVWQHRFWEHSLRDDTDVIRHVEYIHYNPVKHGYVTTPCHWPYSSFHRFVRDGLYPADWGASGMDSEGIGRE
ncbi:transposase [Thiocapsa sp.]|uniref:REP-associated tyrosine transposase n=1 Tax=Thiocapsa sp. TaxID=2024551 RepID=UPI00359486B7